MKQEQFIYRVEINVTMTGADLANLYNVASNHYDAKCKALAKPARPGGRETDGWLHGLMSRFTGEHVLDRSPDFSHTPEGNAEACRANPELTFQVTLNHGLLDTLCKTMEMARGEDECATAWGLMEAFASLRKQAAGVNAHTPEVYREVLKGLEWSGPSEPNHGDFSCPSCRAYGWDSDRPDELKHRDDCTLDEHANASFLTSGPTLLR